MKFDFSESSPSALPAPQMSTSMYSKLFALESGVVAPDAASLLTYQISPLQPLRPPENKACIRPAPASF